MGISFFRSVLNLRTNNCNNQDGQFNFAGVGSINNTFGIKGVQEHTFFFKSITDASKLRRQVSECFERAALPNTSDKVWYHLPIYAGRQTLCFVVWTVFPLLLQYSVSYAMTKSDTSSD